MVRREEDNRFVSISSTKDAEQAYLMEYCKRFNWRLELKDYERMMPAIRLDGSIWVTGITPSQGGNGFDISFLDGHQIHNCQGNFAEAIMLLKEKEPDLLSEGVRLFLEECCVIDRENEGLSEGSKALYEAYAKYLEEVAEYDLATIKKFVILLRDVHGLVRFQTSKYRGLKGVKLKDEYRVIKESKV